MKGDLLACMCVVYVSEILQYVSEIFSWSDGNDSESVPELSMILGQTGTVIVGLSRKDDLNVK